MAYYEDVAYEGSLLKCKLCSTIISDSNKCIDEHIKTDLHKELYINRLLRRNSMVLAARTINCQICQKKFKYSLLKDHIDSRDHQFLMSQIKAILQKDGVFIELSEDQAQQLYCLICDCDISFNLSETLQHVSSSRHRSARSLAVQPLNGIVSVYNSDRDLWCKICQVYFDNYVESIFEHVDHNEEHITNITKLLNLVYKENISIEQYLMDPKLDKVACNKCKTEVPCNLVNLGDHINGSKHNGAR